MGYSRVAELMRTHRPFALTASSAAYTTQHPSREVPRHPGTMFAAHCAIAVVETNKDTCDRAYTTVACELVSDAGNREYSQLA